MSAVENVTVPVHTASPDAMYLRTEIGTATMPDGRPVELSISGATLILTVGRFEGNDSGGRLVQTIKLDELGAEWMRAIDGAGL